MAGWSTSTKARSGLIAGADLEYCFTRNLSISAGLFYAQQGTAFNDSEFKKLEMDYINVPIVANYYIWKGLAIKVGIQPGFNLHSKEILEKETYDLDTNTINIGLPVGLSYDFGNLVLDVRTIWGLTNEFGEYPNVRSGNYSALQLTLGYKIPL